MKMACEVPRLQPTRHQAIQTRSDVHLSGRQCLARYWQPPIAFMCALNPLITIVDTHFAAYLSRRVEAGNNKAAWYGTLAVLAADERCQFIYHGRHADDGRRLMCVIGIAWIFNRPFFQEN